MSRRRQHGIDQRRSRAQGETRKDETLLCSELYQGKACAQLHGDGRCRRTKAEAKYENGILELMLPKKAGAGTKALEIK